MKSQSAAFWVQRFFQEHLQKQRNLSPRTVSAYRDTFGLLVRFLQKKYRFEAEQAPLGALSANRILAFLDHLEEQRHNHIRTRNARLAALRSWVHYLADALGPDLPATTRQILAIPLKRCHQRMLGFLQRDQMQALLAATDQSWTGRRDHLLFLLLYNTGARVSEITGLRVRDVSLTGGERGVQLHGKGRKQRTVPLWPVTRQLLRRWIRTNGSPPDAPLLPNRFGEPLTRWGVAWQLRRLVDQARARCPSLKAQSISPHTLRHTCAMHLLQAGVDIAVIALWLGHESPNTTHLYVEADLEMKQKALDKMRPPSRRPGRFQPTDKLIRYLESL